MKAGTRMRCMLLFYDDGKAREALTEADWERLTQDHVRYYQDVLSKRARLVGSQLLEPPKETVTVRPIDGEVLVTEGATGDAPEWLAGFYLIDCETMNDAVDIAKASPMPDGFGYVEVRPVMEGQARLSRDHLEWR
jgi:hypothetical protein